VIVPPEVFVIVRIPPVRDDTLPEFSSPWVDERQLSVDKRVKDFVGNPE
jgi:hypothetical protein